MRVEISDAVQYIGVDDTTIDLFESQYKVDKGVSYNSYVIMDEKITIMDTVDRRGIEQWEQNLMTILDGKQPTYLVVSHLEPDHAGSIGRLLELFPEITIVGNAKTFQMLPQFFSKPIDNNTVLVKEGDTLSLGKHELTFVMAPMVHWPEVMVTYESTEKILFSADGFGTFGALSEKEPWIEEARRYYFNIVGKYGASVQALLKKVATLDIQMICPLHGPVLKEDLGYYIDKYQTWSSYVPESKGILVAYASIHGNTKRAAIRIAEELNKRGENNVILLDLSRDDMAKAVEYAFQYDRVILAAASYDGGVFPCMHDFLHHLQCKAYQNRKIGILENGSWAPCAARVMKEMIGSMKNVEIVEPVITIKSTLKESDMDAIAELVEHMASKN